MNKKILFFSLFLVLFAMKVFAVEFDGVYMSKSNKPIANPSIMVKRPKTTNARIAPAQRESRDEMVQEFVKQNLIQEVISTSSEFVQLVLRQGKLQLMPDLAYLTAQQIALEVFKQGETSKIIEDSFLSIVEHVNKRLDEGANTNYIQAEVRKKVQEDLSGLKDNDIFKRIGEYMFDQAAKQQQKIMIMQVAQRQAQMAAIAQKQAMMEQAIKAQYMTMMEAYMKQVMMQKLGAGQ